MNSARGAVSHQDSVGRAAVGGPVARIVDLSGPARGRDDGVPVGGCRCGRRGGDRNDAVCRFKEHFGLYYACQVLRRRRRIFCIAWWGVLYTVAWRTGEQVEPPREAVGAFIEIPLGIT